MKKQLLMLLKFLINKLYINVDVSPYSKIGENVTIGKRTFIDKFSEIGDYTYIGKNCNITKSSIGRYCSIANNVSIGQGEHNINKISTSAFFYKNPYEELTKKPCIIGNDVWIGTDAIILRGVTVGNGAVIGANAVVTKDIPAYSIVVGCPAKIIKYRFDPTSIEIIEKSRWWEFNLKEAKKILFEIENQLLGGNKWTK